MVQYEAWATTIVVPNSVRVNDHERTDQANF